MRNENQNMTKRESLLHGQKKPYMQDSLNAEQNMTNTHRTESRAKKKNKRQKDET